MTHGVNDQLRLFMERIDRMEEEKKGIADDIRGVYSEAKSQGFDPKIMKALRKLMKMSRDDRDVYEATLDTYRAAVGLDGTPLGDAADREALKGITSVSINGGAEMSLAEFDNVTKIAVGLSEALAVVRETGKASTSLIQRRLRIGYNAAARLIDMMEEQGFITPPDHLGKRSIIQGRLN